MSSETRYGRQNETPIEGWKAIGAYLQRTERTAKRWESREALPVHRHRHGAGITVYAYPSELDKWRANREPAPVEAPLWRRFSWRLIPAFASIVSLAVVLLTAGSGAPVAAVAQAADGIVTREVWADAAGGGAPSPDGRYMSYIDWQSGNLGIRDLETETDRLLTNDGSWGKGEYLDASTWSPDGTQLAYTWVTESGYELRVVTVDDPKPRVVFRQGSENEWIELQEWSPDGQSILVGFATGPVRSQFALIPVEGGTPRVLKEFESGSIPSAGIARFSPDGRYIVYDRTPGQISAFDLFVLDVSSGKETPLVEHPADDCLFGWSPDGGSVLFLSDRTGTLDFWAIRVADGKPQGEPVLVKSSVGRVRPLGFAQDGTFYYVALKVARDIYAASVDFEKGTVLTPAWKAIKRYEGSNMNPGYSPDGRSLAYVSRRGSMVVPTARGNALCVHSLDTGAERVFLDEFARLGVRIVMGAKWSPDSRSIAVVGRNVAGRHGLYVVHLDTGEVAQAVELPEGVNVTGHDWSSKDGLLIYDSYDSNQDLSRIEELNPETGQKREFYQFAASDNVSGVVASPDGEWLAIRARHDLLMMPRGGGTAADMRRIDLSGLDPQICTKPLWTPDGNYILVGGNTPTSDPASDGHGVLYRVPLEGGRPQRVELEKRFWPGEEPTLHPDGRQIAFTTVVNSDIDVDVWAMENFLPDSVSGE